MDALSHALIAYIISSHPALNPVLPFVIVGAVLPDSDIFFSVIADREPALYLFAHGGIAHSVTGVFILAMIGYPTVSLIATAGIISGLSVSGAGVFGPLALLAGGLLHIAIDTAASPGLPLLAPFTDRKFTLAVLPGPSLLLAFTAIGLVAVTVSGLLSFRAALVLYATTVVAYLAIRTGMFLLADTKLTGRKIPLVNPLRWLLIREDEQSYGVRYYTFFSGYSDETVFAKYRGTGKEEVQKSRQMMDVRRMVFSSYTITAERIGDVLILSDPLREKGYLCYPPKYKRVAVPAGEGR